MDTLLIAALLIMPPALLAYRLGYTRARHQDHVRRVHERIVPGHVQLKPRRG